MTSLSAASGPPVTEVPGRTPMLLCAFALVMSLLLFVVAAWIPVESVQTTARIEVTGPVPRETLVQAHGAEVLGLVGIPCSVALLVTLLLAVAVRKRSLGICAVALGLSATTMLVGVVAFLLFFVLGLFVLPVAACLLAASLAAYTELRRDAG